MGSHIVATGNLGPAIPGRFDGVSIRAHTRRRLDGQGLFWPWDPAVRVGFMGFWGLSYVIRVEYSALA